VLDYAYEGIIAIESKERITLFNPVASRITGIDGTKAIGRKISEVWPELKLEEIILQGKDELGHILKINDVDVLCNKVVLMVNHKAVGAVVTFQDVTQIQKMEARVRRRIYASGHVASFYFDDIICVSETCKKTIETAKSFAATQSSILIVGETGTGKEVFAQSIHNFSKRRQGPFVAVNCAALPAQILESELFGYVGGAFTGASQKGKPGLFEVAHGGTIFLDEIAEMEYGIQGKLLRVLQEKKVMRLGSDKVIPIDVHVLAATNKNLKALVIDKQFRADLYYRLNVLQLKVPPLRKRKEDIGLLAEHFLREHASEERQLTESAIRGLRRYSWPGNVRELQNIIERAIVAAKEESIDADIISQVLEEDDDNGTGNNIITEVLPNEIEEIKKALAASKGKYKQAAALLGISRSTLWRKLKRMGLK
jgi:transcriptional regulator with PAS, ATPase and Fis domain